jgi:hypothetical protein
MQTDWKCLQASEELNTKLGRLLRLLEMLNNGWITAKGGRIGVGGLAFLNEISDLLPLNFWVRISLQVLGVAELLTEIMDRWGNLEERKRNLHISIENQIQQAQKNNPILPV